MAREVLLDKIPIPAENVHRIRGKLFPDQAATAYQAELEAVSGAGKAERLREVLDGPHQPDVLSAQIVRPTDGRLLWLADAAVAVHVRA
jgi:6-phosphogluconolactonase/glucosamine-6-phosphate isomerase/deaminase